MKILKLFLLVGVATPLLADPIPAPPSKKEPPPPMYIAPRQKSKTNITAGYVYDQKPMAQPAMLVTPEQAKSVIDRFKEAYPKLGNPRFLIYINRELIDTRSGIKTTITSAKTERSTVQIDSTVKDPAAVASALGVNNAGSLPPGKYKKQNENVTINQTLKSKDKPELTLADRQTIRDVERLFGRPLRAAGATLIDQSIALQMMEGKPVKNFLISTEGDVAAKEREAVKKIADVVIEVLISSKQITLPGLTGDITYNVPDIQATAVRLSDSKILGQSASAEIVSRSQRPVQYLNVYEVAEATALVLMEDMLLNAK